MAGLTSEEKHSLYAEIRAELKDQISQFTSKKDLYSYIVDRLSQLPHFNWTGIYEYSEIAEELTLFPHYIGLPTDHIKIPKGKGVCGTAVAQNKDLVVEDVRKLDNYLACSVGTRSEIVVLLKDQDHIYGQIDVDSDQTNAFSDQDREELNIIAEVIVEKLKKFA